MSLSIRTWTLIAINGVVLGTALLIGKIAQDVAGKVVEERLSTELVADVSKFLANRTLPVSDAMMGYLRELMNVDWVAYDPRENRIVGSSLSVELNRAFLQAAPPSDGTILFLGDRGYRIASHTNPYDDANRGGREHGASRLFVLIPESRFTEIRQKAMRSVATVIFPIAGGATIVAFVLSFLITAPVRRLTQKIDHLATQEQFLDKEDSTAPPWASLTHKGPTETRRLAEAFRRLIDRLQSAMQRMAGQERLATLGKLSLSIAHELRNPLSGIKMNIRVLQDDSSLQNDPSFAIIVREIDRMDGYLGELFTMAPDKVVSGSPARMTRLSELIQGAVALLSTRFRHLGLTVDFEHATDEQSVFVDANQIRQVIINLLVNASEAVSAGGRIVMRIERRGTHMRVEVQDSGPGVSAAGDIFDAFISDKPNGVGLGLYLSKQIIERHGGRIGYENSPRGATFWFELPASGELAQGQPSKLEMEQASR